MSCFCTDGKISVRINLPLFSTVFPSNSCCFCPVGLSLPTGQKQKLSDGKTVENKGKLILKVFLDIRFIKNLMYHYKIKICE